MKNKRKNEIENIVRMNEIAKIYRITKQYKKCEKYHKNIIMLCDRHPKNETVLAFKIKSLNYLEKSYKSLETTNELLNINPNNIHGLINIANHLKL